MYLFRFKHNENLAFCIAIKFHMRLIVIVYLALVVMGSKKLKKKRGHTLFVMEQGGRNMFAKKLSSVADRLR